MQNELANNVNDPPGKLEIKRLYKIAIWLGIITIAYNIIEGIFSLAYGISDETITLFGFGVDSFIEVLSGVGIVAMILRIQNNPDTPRSQFEKTALRITGVSFYLLSLGLFASIIINLYTSHTPEDTLAGSIIALLSIGTMWLLVIAKRRVGRKLNSQPILSDANCTMVCVYMSMVLLISSLLFKLTGIGFIDSLGSAGLIYFSVKEGMEAFEKAKGLDTCDCGDDGVPQ
ncbi:cation transporter [Chloroflexota bacterium]